MRRSLKRPASAGEPDSAASGKAASVDETPAAAPGSGAPGTSEAGKAKSAATVAPSKAASVKAAPEIPAAEGDSLEAKPKKLVSPPTRKKAKGGSAPTDKSKGNVKGADKGSAEPVLVLGDKVPEVGQGVAAKASGVVDDSVVVKGVRLGANRDTTPPPP